MSALREAEAAGEKVVAHCTHGMGRSGRVGGCLVPRCSLLRCSRKHAYVHGSMACIRGHARTSGARTHTCTVRMPATAARGWVGAVLKEGKEKAVDRDEQDAPAFKGRFGQEG
jgi:hypothetical protein